MPYDAGFAGVCLGPVWRGGVLVAAVVGFVVGCGEQNPLGRRPIVGKVQYRGQPVDFGSIQFLPQDLQRGVSSGALIRDGTYRIVEADGLPPGIYRVVISWPDEGKKEVVEGPPGDERRVAVERLPRKYNTESTLQIEVPQGRGTHEVNFDLD